MNAPATAIAADEGVELGDLTGSLGFLLRLAQVRVYERFFAVFADTPVRPGEFTVLWVIALNPGVPQGTLARVLRVKPAHMTKLVQRLVADGLVRRKVPPQDRRSVHLTLTPAGRTHLDVHRETFLNVHAAERMGLNEAEVAQLQALLIRLAFPPEDTCR